MDNKKNEFFSSFDLLNYEFFPGHCLIDLFSNRFSFHLWKKNVKNHIKNLDDITLTALSNFSSSIVVSDVSIKNLVTMFISHIHMHDKPIIKTIYCVINITFLPFTVVLINLLDSPRSRRLLLLQILCMLLRVFLIY